MLFQFQQYKLKSIDGVLGIQTWSRRMVGADETTELLLCNGYIVTIKIPESDITSMHHS